MEDEAVIASASSGRALCGTYVGGSSELIGSRRACKQLLRPPEGNKFMAPDQAYMMESLYSSSIQAGESFCEEVKKSGWSAAVKLSTGPLCELIFGVGAKASVGGGIDKDKEKKSSYDQKTSEAYHIQYWYIPKASFSIPRHQMRLSDEAFADLHNVRNLGDAQKFLEQYNSHVSTGRYHVGGVLLRGVKMKSKSKTTFRSLLDKFSKNANSGGEVSYMTVKGGMNLVFVKDKSSTSTSQSSKEEATVKATHTAIGPQTDDEEKFKAGLEDKSTWSIIDTSDGAELIPVWEIASNESALRESCNLLREAWQRSIESVAPRTGRLYELLHQSYRLYDPFGAGNFCTLEGSSGPAECQEDILSENMGVLPYNTSSKGGLYTYGGNFLVDRPVANSFEDPCIRMMDRVRHRLEPFATMLSTTRDSSNIGLDEDFDFFENTEGVNEGTSDDGIINSDNTPDFSPLEILVELLVRSDVLVQIALFQLLLEERFAIPLVIPYNEDFNDFRHLLEALNFVQVKVANQESLPIVENTSLPRVVFVSNRQTVSQRESADMACEVMNCQFPSKYIKSDIGGGPTIVELGIGFLESSSEQVVNHIPCLVFCVSGDHNKLGKILEMVGDIVIIETDPDTKPTSSLWFSGAQFSTLFWSINSSKRGFDKSSCHMWGKFKDITKGITQYVLKAINLKRFKGYNGGAISLAECFHLLNPLNRRTPICSIGKLEAIDFNTVRPSLTLQKLYTEEANYYFESLQKRGRIVELEKKMQRCKEDRRKASDVIQKLPILQLFVQLLLEKQHVKRSMSILHLQLLIDRKLQPTLEIASKKVIDAFDKMQKNPKDVILKDNYQRAMSEHVDKMLGLEHLWRELSHIFVADPEHQKHLPKLASHHLLDGFPLEILDGDATNFHKLWVDTILIELNGELHALLKRKPKVFVLSVVGLQSSGKSTLLNVMFGTKLKASAGMCTRGVFLQLVKSEWLEFDYVLILDTMGLRAPEFFGRKDSEAQDNRLATFAVLPADACVVMVANEEDNGLKEVLPMVMLAFKGSALAEGGGGKIQSKLFFVYRSVDVNDVKKLGKNQRKLQVDLQEASLAVANFKICETSNLFVKQVRDGVSPLNNFQINSEDEKRSDVKFFGNLKKGTRPPGDIPDWEYGSKVEELRQYIHERVLDAGRWSAHGLLEWKDYLGMVWQSISEADFELSFLNHIEHANYQYLQTRISTSRQNVGKKWQDEFELLTNRLQVGENIDQPSFATLWSSLKLRVTKTVKNEDEEVYKILEQRQYQKWKVAETKRWDDDRLANDIHWKAQLQDCIDGILGFDNVVKEYVTKIQLEISDVGRIHHDIDLPGREKKMKEAFEELFGRILQDAAIKHPPMAKNVGQKIHDLYVNSPVVGRQFTFEDNADKKLLKPIVWFSSNSVIQGWKSLFGRDHGLKDAEYEVKTLIPLVQSALQDAKQYSGHLVVEVMQLTQQYAERHPKNVQHVMHKLVKGLLTDKLTKIQEEWDSHHNVAKRLETQHRDYLWQSFLNHANKVDGTKMLSTALCKILEAKQLLDAFKVQITKSVSNNLQSREEWVCNWKVMRAHLDLHLIKLIKSKKIQKLLKLVSDGALHYKTVVDKFIKKEIEKQLADKGDWTRFVGLICDAMKDAAVEASHSKSGISKPLIFQQSIVKSLGQLSPDLARGISVNVSKEVCSKYSDDIDFCQIRDDVSASVNRVQLDMTSSTQEVIDMVRSRLINSKTDSARARCDVMCPRCTVTCLNAANHSGKHNALHQPEGLCGIHWSNSKELGYESCSKSVVLDQVMREGGERIRYREWTTKFTEWMLPSEELGTVEVREYIFAHFQKELLQKYSHCKACSNIPNEFKQHSLQTLQLNLQNVIRSNHNYIPEVNRWFPPLRSPLRPITEQWPITE